MHLRLAIECPKWIWFRGSNFAVKHPKRCIPATSVLQYIKRVVRDLQDQERIDTGQSAKWWRSGWAGYSAPKLERRSGPSVPQPSYCRVEMISRKYTLLVCRLGPSDLISTHRHKDRVVVQCRASSQVYSDV